ncbi:hypothetical protein [Mycobacterium parmense]|uniref:Uncharacterized protein n=1 Tax=Mycobacterium parmense TaxID=185642 RepID=A0A7I7YUE9_9MYCO|nr:hypothetical protein AWC20_06515 [Mycobacterium parmense]BBZ45508.1 hypothetical protein MPRM_27890 [Mycobacterium parmense]
MAGIHRERPGAADLAAATGAPAIPLGNQIWMSPGVSNAGWFQHRSTTDLVLKADPAHAGARAVAAYAHEALLDGTDNFWKRAWLTKSISELRPS